MLFSEIYGSYFNVVAAIISEASQGCMTDQRMTGLIHEKAFAESALAIPAALKNEVWPLLDGDMKTVLRHSPSMPLTLLQKRWMKALLQDPRIALFSPDTTGLEDVKPLYRPDTFVFFDQYTDGDPYEDEGYIIRFRTILQAIRERRLLRICFRGHTGIRHSLIAAPSCLEYSAKDDKFRLYARSKSRPYTINLARISSCELLESHNINKLRLPEKQKCELTLLLHDERNALERVLLHFSHFEKETQKLDHQLYQMKLRYDREDETELLIRVLSFGPMLEVTAPDPFIRLVKERLDRQRQLFS